MMTYILIGVLIVIGAAIFFTIRNDKSKSKEIVKLQGNRDSLNHTIDLLNDELELLRGQNIILREERMQLKKKAEFWEATFREVDKDWKESTDPLSLQTLSKEQLKRWEQLIDDCKKPINGRKRPINVGGKFTRSSIIAVGDIINSIKNLNEGAPHDL